MLLILAAFVSVVASQAPPPPLGAVWDRTNGNEPFTFSGDLFAVYQGECPFQRTGEDLDTSQGSRLLRNDGGVAQNEDECKQACLDAGSNCLAARFDAVTNARDRCWNYTRYACQPLRPDAGCTFYRRVGCRSCQIAEEGNINNEQGRAPCVLPFEFDGRIYKNCSTNNVPVGRSWCPTNTSRFDPSSGEYGLCTDQNICRACDNYRREDDTSYLGGTIQDDVDTLEECKVRCNQAPDEATCYGIDYTDTDECYLHLNPLQESRRRQDQSVTHYTKIDCDAQTTPQPRATTGQAECEDRFRTRDNTGLYNGREQPASTNGLTECTEACLANADCVAFNIHKVEGTCWLVVTGETSDLREFSDTALASFIREPCPQSASSVGGACVDTFRTVQQQRAYGGSEVSRAVADTAFECQDLCLAEPTCRSVDFDYLTTGPQCYWFTEEEEDLNLFPVDEESRIDHFIRTPCQSPTQQTTQPPSGCLDTFDRVPGNGAHNGRQQRSGTSVPLCRQLCLNDDSCVGFDFVETGVSTQRCFIHTDEDALNNQRYLSAAVDLYVREPCRITGTFRTTQGVCTDTFIRFVDTNSQDGIYYSGGTTRARCEERCLQLDIADCKGYDWDSGSTQKCWLHSSTSILNPGPASGVNQYERQDCTRVSTTLPPDCIDTFRVYQGFEMTNAEEREYRTRESCQESCLSDPDCEGFNFVAEPLVVGSPMCFHLPTSNFRLIPSGLVAAYLREPCSRQRTSTAASTGPGPFPCVDDFSIQSNTFSYEGREVANAGSFAECAEACRTGTAGENWRRFFSSEQNVFIFDDDDCLGFDLSTSSNGNQRCYIHTDANDFSVKEQGSDVDQYTRIPCDEFTSTTVTSVTSPTAQPQACRNRESDANCNTWERNGSCEQLRNWMFINCYKACSRCDSATTEAPVGVCDGPYRRLDGKYGRNSVPYTANPTASRQQCKEACESAQGLPACVGFDYRASVQPTCTLHYDADDVTLENLLDRSDTDHYQFDEACGARPPICDGPYRIFTDVYARGGTPYQESPEATLDQCKAACQGSELCLAFDYSTERTPFCWRHFDARSLTEANVRTLIMNNHYRFDDDCGERPPPGPGCIGYYFEFPETNAVGARRIDNIDDLEACLRQCESTSSCTSVDFNVGVNDCWLHSTDVSNSLRTSLSVNHYRLIRRCNEQEILGLVCDVPQSCACPEDQMFMECGSACTPTCADPNPPCTLQCVRRCQCPATDPLLAADGVRCISEAQCPIDGCTVEFEEREDTNAFDGEAVPGANTEEECKQACINNASCTVVDYDGSNFVDNRCFIHTDQSAIDNPNSSPGVSSFVITRICDGSTIASVTRTTQQPLVGSCSGAYRVFDDVYARGGTPFGASVSLGACSSACDNTAACVGFDYSLSRDPHCWHHFNESNLRRENVFALDGNMHYRFDSTCGDRPEITSTAVPCGEFELLRDRRSLGAVPRGTLSVADCQQRCRDDPECAAIDYRRDSSACWLHLSESNLVRVLNNNDIDQYRLHRCEEEATSTVPPCEDAFVLRTNRSIGGAGRVQGTFTSAECKQECVDDARCTAIDYVRASGQCWIHTRMIDPNDLQDNSNVDHYTLVGRCSTTPMDSTTVTTTTTEPTTTTTEPTTTTTEPTTTTTEPTTTTITEPTTTTTEPTTTTAEPTTTATEPTTTTESTTTTTEPTTTTESTTTTTEPTTTTGPPEICPADIALVVDTSGSITEKGRDNWDIVKMFVANLADALVVSRRQNHVAAITFSENARIEFPFLFDLTQIGHGIDNFFYEGGNTNIAQALSLTRVQLFSPSAGDRTEAANVVVVVTDGNSTMDRDRVEEEARKLKEKARVLVVGVTNDVDVNEVNKIVSDPAYYHPVNAFAQLMNVLQAVINNTESCDVPIHQPPPRPENAVALSVGLTGNTRPNTRVEYDRVITDISGSWNSSRYYFEAPAEGYYVIHWTASSSAGSQISHVVADKVALTSLDTTAIAQYMQTRTVMQYLRQGEPVWVDNKYHGSFNLHDPLTSTSLTIFNLPTLCPVVWAAHKAPQQAGRLRFDDVMVSNGAAIYNATTSEMSCPIDGFLLIAFSVSLEAEKAVKIVLRGGSLQPATSSLSTHSNGRTTLSRQILQNCSAGDRFYFEITNGEVFSDEDNLQTSLTVLFCSRVDAVAFAVYESNAHGPIIASDLDPFQFDTTSIDTKGAFQGNRYTVTESGVYYFYLSTAAQQQQLVRAQIMTMKGAVVELRRDSTSHNGIETMGRGVLIGMEKGDMIWVQMIQRTLMYSDTDLHTSFFGIKVYN